MTDHLDTIRATAQAEAQRRGSVAVSLGGYRNEGKEDAFVRGAVWLASRLTREKIAIALFEEANGYAYTEEYEQSREWDGACDQADTVLALMLQGGGSA